MKESRASSAFAAAVLIVAALSGFASCTSIPSTYKLQNHQWSFGVNLRIVPHKDGVIPNFDFDFRNAINRTFDLGITIAPGILFNVVTPYIVGIKELGPQTNALADLQFPVYFGVVDAAPGYFFTPSVATGFNIEQRMNALNRISAGFGWDLTGHVVMSDSSPGGGSWWDPLRQVTARLNYLFETANTLWANTLESDLTGKTTVHTSLYALR